MGVLLHIGNTWGIPQREDSVKAEEDHFPVVSEWWHLQWCISCLSTEDGYKDHHLAYCGSYFLTTKDNAMTDCITRRAQAILSPVVTVSIQFTRYLSTSGTWKETCYDRYFTSSSGGWRRDGSPSCSRNWSVSTGGAGCFSFYPTKNMTTGEGGMVTTSTRTRKSGCDKN